MRLIRRIQHLLNRDKRERELLEEIELHRAMAEAEYQEQGLAPEKARQVVSRRMGNATTALESARSVWLPYWLEGFGQDLRHAWRGLRRSPILLAMVCVSLGLSTGFGTAIFSVINGVLLQPLTARDADALVSFQVGSSNRVSWLNLQDICETSPSLSCVGYALEELNWLNGSEFTQLTAQVVSPEYFTRLGISVAMGNAFDGRSVLEDADRAVVSHTFWQRQLGGDPAVIGRKVVLNGHPYAIAGVLSPAFRSLWGLGVSPSFYIPANSTIRSAKNATRADGRYEMIAVLQPGQNLAQLRAMIQARVNDLERLYPRDNVDFTRQIRAEAVHRLGLILQSEDRMTTVLLLFGSVVMLLILLLTVVACINVAGMLVARAMARKQEISMRINLGCGKMRLARLLIAESLLLSIVGVVSGAVLSVWLARALVSVPLPFPVPFAIDVPVDGNLLAFLALIVVLATVVSGLAPILHAWRTSGSVRSGQGVPAASRRWSLRGGLIVAQVALSAVLLMATGLFVRSLWSASQIHPGFDLDRVVTIEMDTRTAQMTNAQVAGYHSNVVAGMREVRGVSGVSGALVIPLSLDSIVTSIQIDRNGNTENVKAPVNWILPGYFQVMGIPLRSGRDFVSNDRQPKPIVAVVNHAFARLHFPDGVILGRRIRRPGPEGQVQWAEVIGVVADARYLTLGEEPRPQVYWPITAGADSKMKVHVRTEGDAVALARQLPEVLRDIDPRVIVRVKPLRAVMAIALFPAQAAALMLSALGIVAWVLSVAGLYGVVAYSVGRRIPEIGIRMALGATPANILRLLLRDGISLASIGVAIGIALAAVGAPFLGMFLAGVAPRDPVTFVLVAVALLLTAIAASYWPARKGTSLTPASALRND